MQILTPNSSALYTGVANAISRISTTEGMYALWRGIGSMVLGAGPSHALYFATYEQCKDMFGANDQDHNHLAHGKLSLLEW